MYEKEMQMLFDKRNKWNAILINLGCHPDSCEDIIQDMYLKVYDQLNEGKNIKYNDSINYYYIFKILRSLFIDLRRKEKNIIVVDMKSMTKIENNEPNTDVYLQVENELKNMYWYDRKVFEILTEGESISALSRKTGISYHSLYKTFKKVKKKIKKLL